MANEINNCKISLNYKDVVAVFHFTMSSLSLSSHWKNTFTFLQQESSLLPLEDQFHFPATGRSLSLCHNWEITFILPQLGDHFPTTGRSLSHNWKTTFTFPPLEDHFPTTGRQNKIYSLTSNTSAAVFQAEDGKRSLPKGNNVNPKIMQHYMSIYL